MNRLHTFARDDENDTRLFEKLEEYVLKHYPNPRRIGCLDYDILKSFVETPEKLDLTDPKYLHVIKCAECTRVLRGLRRVREEQLLQGLPGSLSISKSDLDAMRIFRQRLMAAAAWVRASVVGFAARLKVHSTAPIREALANDAVPVTIDLSYEPLAELREGSFEHCATLQRKLIHLHLVLPLGSPAGIYRITVASKKDILRAQADASAIASVKGSHAELHVMLDLRAARSGDYFLVMSCEGDGVPHFFRFLLH